MKGDLDEIDLKILTLLMKDAQMPYTEVAKKVFVSSGTVHVRMKKMTDMGLIKGSSLTVDYSKLGYDIKAFLGVYMEKSALYDDVLQQLKEIPEIISIDYTTGNYGMFIQVLCRDTEHLREVLHDKIQMVEGISRTETMLSLEESVARKPTLNR